MGEIPNTPDFQPILDSLGRDVARTTVERFHGGFTAAEKYIVKDAGQEYAPLFVKLIPKNHTRQHEVTAIAAEIRNYQLLDELGHCGKVFPRVRQEISDEKYIGVALDYYEDATWAGPWDAETIQSTYDTLAAIHSSAVSSRQLAMLKETKKLLGNNLIPIEEQYASAITAFRDRKVIINSRGEIVFEAPDDSLYHALFEMPPRHVETEQVLIAQDVNKHNVCIDRNKNIHLVDPVYLDMGDRYQDLMNIAQDIINDLPPAAAELPMIKRLFIPSDKHNPYRLNGIVYGLMAIQKPYDGNPRWMDYQQDSLIIKLQLWYDQI